MSPSGTRTLDRIIDAHVHLWDPDVFVALGDDDGWHGFEVAAVSIGITATQRTTAACTQPDSVGLVQSLLD